MKFPQKYFNSAINSAMRYIEAPNIYEPEDGECSLFLGGGISACSDWQQEMTQLLGNTPLAVLNPRRRNFSIHDSQAAFEQIRWEHTHLRAADAILFWFPPETLCPITLYELGAWSMTYKPLFVGIHPDYQRRRDVEIQTQLARPDVIIVYSLAALAQQIMNRYSVKPN